MEMSNPEILEFRKSAHSGAANNSCVEVAPTADAVYVRDSKDPGGAVLKFTHSEWGAFISGVRDGEFDLP